MRKIGKIRKIRCEIGVWAVLAYKYQPCSLAAMGN